MSNKFFKRLVLTVSGILFMVGVIAQSPEKISYQAVIRDAENNLLTNRAVGMKISVMQGSVSGTLVYEEIYNPNPITNTNGLITVEIGGGVPVFGTFSNINWSDGQYFIKTETDPAGGTNYTITGTSQLLSVPYALHSKTAQRVTGPITETDPVFMASVSHSIASTDTANWNHKLDSYSETQSLSDVIAINGSANAQIKNVTDPSEAQDAATKAYVDNLKELIYNELMDAGLNGIVKDADGNTYKTIKIGNQVWMAENLRTTNYNDSSDIPLVTDNTAWANLTTPGYCWYNNNSPTYARVYGALYNWYVVETGKLCPTGWHVPTYEEWTALSTYLGGITAAGGKLKETGTRHWLSPNTGATNETGFTALPGGYRTSSGAFGNIGVYGFWWTKDSNISNNAYMIYLPYGNAFLYFSGYPKFSGLSVRCLRD